MASSKHSIGATVHCKGVRDHRRASQTSRAWFWLWELDKIQPDVHSSYPSQHNTLPRPPPSFQVLNSADCCQSGVFMCRPSFKPSSPSLNHDLQTKLGSLGPFQVLDHQGTLNWLWPTYDRVVHTDGHQSQFPGTQDVGLPHATARTDTTH